MVTSPADVTITPTFAAAVTPALPTPTFTASATADKPIGTQKKSSADGMVQMYVPAGVFQMGTGLAGDWTGEDEFPLHEISLPSYWIDQVEVTNAMYGQCAQAGICKSPHALASQTRPKYFDQPDFAAYPVIQVDWSQADAYCRWAGRRLPSEAEWEKAARGPQERLYPWAGDAVGSHFTNFDIYDDWPNADTTAVGKYPAGASPYGALDMVGNVSEWTADWYAADYYGKSPSNQPTGPETGTARVIRGGAWSSDKLFLRTASRMSFYPDLAANDIGFRCVESEGNP
jgi:formylglycine-generating enzyme required for sulfatase activity